jgi:prepilin-type N-terminal cleavage/methylation domain-containing protein
LQKTGHHQGFTLIELSIVLVIIGLVVGGVLVGQNLIAAAGVRATISQIEKYQTAVKTFQDKYGALPGDMNAATASQFGFVARGVWPGTGDGNGIIEGEYGAAPENGGWIEMGETTLFWVDLSMANLIDGSFNTAGAYRTATNITGATLNAWLPQAKLGNGNYIYVLSGGWQERLLGGVANAGSDGNNYFGISAVTEINGTSQADILSSAGLTVQQAYSIDAKIDDGLPQSGNVTTVYLNGEANWAAGGGVQGAWQYGGTTGFAEAPTATATPGSATTCYDNGNVGGATQQYSVEVSSGSNVNCALSFRFQ